MTNYGIFVPYAGAKVLLKPKDQEACAFCSRGAALARCAFGRSARPMLEKSDNDRRGRGADAWLAYTAVGSNCFTPVLYITNSGTARYISTSATRASQRLSRINQLPSRRAATTA